jgi:hypothetical protein
MASGKQGASLINGGPINGVRTLSDRQTRQAQKEGMAKMRTPNERWQSLVGMKLIPVGKLDQAEMRVGSLFISSDGFIFKNPDQERSIPAIHISEVDFRSKIVVPGSEVRLRIDRGFLKSQADYTFSIKNRDAPEIDQNLISEVNDLLRLRRPGLIEEHNRAIEEHNRAKEELLKTGQVNAWQPLYEPLGFLAEDMLAFEERRVLRGTVLSTSGLTGLVVGSISMAFDQDSLNFAIQDATNAKSIPYREITTFNFSGRGKFQTSEVVASQSPLPFPFSDFGTTRTQTHTETILTVEWLTGGLVMTTDTGTPDQIASDFKPILKLIEAENRDWLISRGSPSDESRPDLVSQIERLSVLHENGSITDEEFSNAKLRILDIA